MLKSFTDQLNNNIQVSFPPRRIVSLVPSQTELLHDLGLENEVVGITKFCVHPSHFRQTKKLIGGTKQFDFDIVDSLQPDLIIGNKEENYPEGIDRLRKKYPVWMSDIFNLQDAISMIDAVGELTNTSAKAQAITQRIKEGFQSIKKYPSRRVLYMIWRRPWMAAGGNTFIGSMLETIGFRNCLDKPSRYPELIDEQIKEINPEVILLSSEPFPFKEIHIKELQNVLPETKVMLVDGEMFSWYGSRLIKAPEYFNGLLR